MSRVLRFEVPPGKPVLRGHDHYWRVIRDLDHGGPWSINDVHGFTNGAARQTVLDFVKRLVAGGFAKTVYRDKSLTRYRLIKGKAVATTPCLRRDGSKGTQGRGQIQMWNVIRGPVGRDGFTFDQLALFSSTETVTVKPSSAERYIKHLALAGYLLKLSPGRRASWRLKPAMNTGPKPPMITRGDIVFDQNREEAIGPFEAREVSP